ncbi:GTP cyclohydrolase I FolE [Homoserinimonas sp. A447]
MPRTTGSVATTSTSGVDTERIQAAVTELLYAIGDDPSRAGLLATPGRVAQAYGEFFSGVGVDPLTHLAHPISGDSGGELVLLRDIEFRSICEHHLLPFLGVAHIAYAPGDSIVGLGSLARVVDTVASRPQLQERLTEEIADALNDGLSPRGVLVVTDAVHGCVTARGVQQVRSSTVTVASRGILSDPIERAEVMALIGQAEGSTSA